MTEDVSAMRRLFRDIPMCRVATVRPDGGPHVAPRWFVWLDDAIWVATRVAIRPGRTRFAIRACRC